MEVQQNKKYIVPTMRVITPICSEDTMGDLETGSKQGGDATPDAKQHTSFSSWDDEEEAED